VNTREILALAAKVGICLAAPLLVGALVDRRFAAGPRALISGAVVAVVVASALIARRFLQRLERLAPTIAEEDSE
jgi:hypothetical protein